MRNWLLILAIGAGAGPAATGALAQAAAAMSSEIVAAPAIPPDRTIPLDQALAAVRAAQAACLLKNSPTTVEVVDLNGNIKVLLSADGARGNSFEAARRKAYTVLKKGMASSAFARSIGSPPVNTLIENDPSLRPSGGGVPIVRNGAIIGALAVSGPTGQVDDEACAIAGMAEFKF
jgi:glc operon protein GlcG